MSHGDEQYGIGDLLEITVEFTNLAGQPADPAEIDFFIRDPTGNTVALDESDATNPNVGEWKWMMPAAFDKPGTWRFRAAGLSGVVASVERTASVAKTLFG